MNHMRILICETSSLSFKIVYRKYLGWIQKFAIPQESMVYNKFIFFSNQKDIFITNLWDSVEGMDKVCDCDRELQFEIWLKEQDCVVGNPGVLFCWTQCWACVICTECLMKSWSLSFDWQLPNISIYAITET